jgi:nucleotide-binding universal stress UspA family protein
MSIDKVPLLLCTNGSSQSQPALDYGIWLASQLRSPVHLLGVLEDKSRETALNKLLSICRLRLNELRLPYELVLQRGKSELLIPEQSNNKQVLAVFGPLGRAAWMRSLFGRSLRRMLRNITVPMIYTRSAPNKMDRMLLCMGGLQYSLSMVETALQLASKSKPEVTLLHIVEPGEDKSQKVRALQSNLLDQLQTNSPEAHNLQASLELVKKYKMKGRLVVRQGLPVREIVEEARSGRYDLVGMGSLYSAKSLRNVVISNVSAEVAEQVDVPLLIVRTRMAEPQMAA